MISENEPQPDALVEAGPARPEDIEGIIELMLARPPAFWMRKVSREAIRAFLKHSVNDPRCVLLAARLKEAASPVGYVLAVLDSRRFWAGFFLKNPLLAPAVVFHRLMRLRDLRQKNRVRAKKDPASAGLPTFAWSPSGLGHARIIGLYVLKDHRARGVAMDLYFALFDALREKGCTNVEEYAAPDYAEFAGKFPKLCGWSLQACVCGGFKITRAL